MQEKKHSLAILLSSLHIPVSNSPWEDSQIYKEYREKMALKNIQSNKIAYSSEIRTRIIPFVEPVEGIHQENLFLIMHRIKSSQIKPKEKANEGYWEFSKGGRERGERDLNTSFRREFDEELFEHPSSILGYIGPMCNTQDSLYINPDILVRKKKDSGGVESIVISFICNYLVYCSKPFNPIVNRQKINSQGTILEPEHDTYEWRSIGNILPLLEDAKSKGINSDYKFFQTFLKYLPKDILQFKDSTLLFEEIQKNKSKDMYK